MNQEVPSSTPIRDQIITEEDRIFAEANGARMETEGEKLVEFRWDTTPGLMPQVQDQHGDEHKDCQDCWVRAVCSVLKVCMEIMYKKIGNRMEDWCIHCTPAEVLGDIGKAVSLQELMEGLKKNTLDKKERKDFINDMVPFSAEAKILIDLLVRPMERTHKDDKGNPISKDTCYPYLSTLA